MINPERSPRPIAGDLMLLRRHNLNLLPILRELLRTRSVARTAETVGLSQSAVSAALARLRKTYGDELLVMVGRRLELTERGRELIAQTERVCQEAEILLRPQQFDPQTEQRRFVVSAADYITLLLAPELTRALADEAPHASVHFIDYAPDLPEQLARGTIDIVALPTSSAGWLAKDSGVTPLFVDETVVIASARNKAFSGPLTREIYKASRHAMFQRGEGSSSSHEARALRNVGVAQQDVVLVEQFLTLPAIVEASACLALVQRRLAERFQASNDIEIHTPPFPTEPLEINAYWAPPAERDPAHAWLRKLMADVASRL